MTEFFYFLENYPFRTMKWTIHDVIFSSGDWLKKVLWSHEQKMADLKLKDKLLMQNG